MRSDCVSLSEFIHLVLALIQLAIIAPAACWTIRRARRASRDLRRTNFYAARALQVLAPSVTHSGVPAVWLKEW